MGHTKVYFILLTMLIVVQAVRAAACKDDSGYCKVSPGNIESLWEVLQSNTFVELEKGNYHIFLPIT